MILMGNYAKRARLWTAITSALLLPFGAVAGDLGAGQTHTVKQGDPAEQWTLIDGAALTIEPNANALGIDSTASTLVVTQGNITSTNAANTVQLVEGSAGTFTNARIVNTVGGGLGLTSGLAKVPSSATVSGGYIGGAAHGVSVQGSSTATFDGTDIEGVSATASGLRLLHGSATLRGGASVSGGLNGVLILQDERGSEGLPSVRNLVVDGSTVEGVAGAGIFLDTLRVGTTDASISILNGSEVRGGNGIAFDFDPNVHADILVRDSHILGDVRVADTASTTMSLLGSSTLDGAMNGDIAATLSDTSRWNMAANSTISSFAVSGGTVDFAPTNDGTHRNLTIHGDLSGAGGGAFALNTSLNEGGALASQGTDRVLVEGNVITTGPIEIVVKPAGPGALTDINQNGMVESGEGISLVQVAGTSRADAFTLRGGYVAAGPWQYVLRAFGPTEVEQAQNALASGALSWDYRLGNEYVCKTDCGPVGPVKPVDPVDPVDPGEPGNPDNPGDPGNPVDPVLPPPGGRVAVVPQLPSYLSAPAALLTYGDMMNDGLQQRLGDIRNGASHDPVGGDVFARYLGGQLRYSSNLSFQNYGYDFDQQINALQVGGSLIALDGDNGNLRAGWALDSGSTRVTPKAADGNSAAKYNANGISAWMTWQHGNGFWVDGVLGSTRYHGDVGTDLRGGDVGRVQAQGWTMSVETGMPFALGNEWTVEPRFQLKHQQLNFRDFTDEDGLDVRLGTAKQTSATLGGRISRTANPIFMPYANLDLTHTTNGDPSADVSSEDWGLSQRFNSGRVGNSYRVAAGAVSQLGAHVQIYGEGTYQHFVGGYGMQGWAGNVGVRVTF